MASEARGQAKEAENLRWLVGYAAGPKERRGGVYVDFGTPVPLRARLAELRAESITENPVERVALDVCHRLNADHTDGDGVHRVVGGRSGDDPRRGPRHHRSPRGLRRGPRLAGRRRGDPRRPLHGALGVEGADEVGRAHRVLRLRTAGAGGTEHAGEVMWRNARTARSGRIEVLVLPPIPTTGWTKEDIDAAVPSLQRPYEELLDNWPT